MTQFTLSKEELVKYEFEGGDVVCRAKHSCEYSEDIVDGDWDIWRSVTDLGNFINVKNTGGRI